MGDAYDTKNYGVDGHNLILQVLVGNREEYCHSIF